MNDPNKAINVNLSSLLSLKAELIRKQAEVNKAKAAQTVNKHIGYTSKKTYNSTATTSSNGGSKLDKKLHGKEVEKHGDIAVYEYDDSEMLEKSKRVLEAKSKFYERMSRTGGKLNSDDNCLVLFNRKRQDERLADSLDGEQKEENPGILRVRNQSELDPTTSESEEDRQSSNDEEDWVEYIDCLGRTRKCLRPDLEVMKRRDAELAASMPERLDQTKANWMLDARGADGANTDDDAPIGPIPNGSLFGDGVSLMSKHDEQRANWERKEQENLDKMDVHYQDVFFDEARQHGVGYYAFSTDEDERKKQQRELEESRKHTIEEQKHRDELRAKREKIIAERVLAAKNRQRARLGLEPLDEEKVEEVVKETKEERKARKRADKLKRKQEQEEEYREEERRRHVRPWDKEKDGIPSSSKLTSEDETEAVWTYKPERLPMSQEEWNEKKRSERISEFAPVNEPLKRQPNQPKRTNFTSIPTPIGPSTEPSVHSSYNKPPPPPSDADTFASYQSSKIDRTFQRRRYAVEQDVEPQRQGATIPPPVDLDYLPAPHTKKTKSSNELERSIEAGLRFLRENCDKGNLTTKSSWTAKADY